MNHKYEYTITIQGKNQPALVEALEQAIIALKQGHSYRNVGAGNYDLRMNPTDDTMAECLREEYVEAHPHPKSAWRE